MHKKIISTLTLGLILANTLQANADTKLNDINGHWANKEIQEFVDKGYIHGYPEDNTFRPNNTMTRAEFVKTVNKYFGFTSKGDERFTDVDSNHWFYNDVCIALKEGYLNGYPDNTFRPNAPITREEVSKIIVTLLDKKDINYDKINSFTDMDNISEWAKPYIEGAIEEGIIKGDNGFIYPTNNIKRGEAVVMLSRVDNEVKPPVVNTAPVISANDLTIKQGANFSYDMLGATATDAEGDEVTISYAGTVDTNVSGKYQIVITATDGKLSSSKTVVVTVEKKEEVSNDYANSAEFKNAVFGHMLSLVNNHRSANGLSAFTAQSRLIQSANDWSAYMANNGVFDHTVNGNTAADVCVSLNGVNVGENIALMQFRLTGDVQQDAQNLANQLFDMWKKSAPHNATMLSKYDKFFGFGFYAQDLGGGVYSIWATQHFDMFEKSVKEEAPVVEEVVEEEVVVPEVEEEVVVPEVQEPSVEMEDTTTEPTVEIN